MVKRTFLISATSRGILAVFCWYESTRKVDNVGLQAQFWIGDFLEEIHFVR
jgi:hypothetical protein